MGDNGHHRYSGVKRAEIGIEIPGGKPADALKEMGQALAARALAEGIDLHEILEDKTGAKRADGGPKAFLERIERGVAHYTVIRRMGRGEK